MRIDRHAVRCRDCPSKFALENEGFQLCNNLQDVMERAARYVGWLIEGELQLCVLHRGKK